VTRELSAILMLANRDFLKLLRDRTRLIGEIIFPVIFIGALGGSLQANLGPVLGFNFIDFMFTGVFAMTIWQTTALGIVSLIEDRENDFSQEIFVSPISRYSILLGKILGETLVASPVAVVIVLFGMLLGIEMTLTRAIGLLFGGLAVAFFGGAFGVLVLANLKHQRTANQIFPFVILPQYFLAGIFNPIAVLPWYLDILSRVSPLRYAVDLIRGLFYGGDQGSAVLASPQTNLLIMVAAFAVFMIFGTAVFVRSERNR
jgi:ABC-2 type transport system permease protein